MGRKGLIILIKYELLTDTLLCDLSGLSHGREASVQYEEALRQQRMCRELRRRTPLSDVIKAGLTSVTALLQEFEEHTDLMAILDPPDIMRMYSHSQ